MIYCVEDDGGIRELVVCSLRNTGFDAEGFESGEPFFKALKNGGAPELVLLDIMLPGEDGFAILKKLRSNPNTRDIPVILLTAKNAEFDKVSGLDGGADDYVTKPFGIMELISRIKAVLRRSGGRAETGDGEKYSAFGIVLDARKHIVTADGEEVGLTLKAFEVLRLLLKNRGAVITRDTLLERVWGYDFDGETRTVDVHIRSLRRKLGDSGKIIKTVRGVGYRIED